MPHAFIAFHAAHHPALLAVARQRLGTVEDAEDAVAETFRIAWDHYRTSGEVEVAWVYRTLRNVIGNEYQRAQGQVKREDRLRALHVVAGSSDLDVGVMVRQELAALSEADREVLRLAYWEDLGAQQIGRVLGCSTGAARVRLRRARGRLEQRLAPTTERRGGERHGG